MKLKYFLLILTCLPLPLGARSIESRSPRTTETAQPSKAIAPKTDGDRKKTKWAGFFGKKSTFSTMTYEELAIAKEEQKAKKNWESTIKYLERMITLCEGDNSKLNEKARLIIELADLLFEQQKYDDAAKWYTTFTQLYPGNNNIEYASYKAIVCSSKKILSIDRDQTATEKTLELTHNFLKRADIFKKYTPAVEKIQHHCYQTLAQSDCNVASFYMKYGNPHAAEQRLKAIRTDWLEKVPELHPALVQLELELATINPQFKTSASTTTVVAQAKPTKKADMTARF